MNNYSNTATCWSILIWDNAPGYLSLWCYLCCPSGAVQMCKAASGAPLSHLWLSHNYTPPSTCSDRGNHRPTSWRQPARLRVGHPAWSIPLHFLSICSGLFINNYCLAELQWAGCQGQGESRCDLSPRLGWVGSLTATRGQTWQGNVGDTTPVSAVRTARRFWDVSSCVRQ